MFWPSSGLIWVSNNQHLNLSLRWSHDEWQWKYYFNQTKIIFIWITSLWWCLVARSRNLSEHNCCFILSGHQLKTCVSGARGFSTKYKSSLTFSRWCCVPVSRYHYFTDYNDLITSDDYYCLHIWCVSEYHMLQWSPALHCVYSLVKSVSSTTGHSSPSAGGALGGSTL